MRPFALTIGLLGLAAVARADGAGEPPLPLYWQPPGAPAPLADKVHAAFAEALVRRGTGPPIDRSPTAIQPAPLGQRLLAAVADYRAFRFDEAAAALSELARAAEAEGGAGLDARQLADLYLHRGLARLELGRTAEAWEDLVRAARMDPTRALDPAQFPPRAAATYRRAVAEVALAPHAELEVRVPDGAIVSVDGHVVAGTRTIALGQHLVRVEAPGFQPWAGLCAVVSQHERFEPPLQPWQPPDPDALVEAARAAGARAGAVVLGALRRTPGGWRFLARRVELPGGQTVTEDASLDTAPVQRVVDDTVRRLLEPSLLLAAPPRPLPDPPPWYRRWWLWALAGGVAAALAISIPLATASPSPPSSTGTASAVGPFR
ncbi:MAG TPA: hypothetical protein VKN99_25580 [Polyangia bacterium]|nr:hypothetical protein [Polyangia bacterium]